MIEGRTRLSRNLVRRMLDERAAEVAEGRDAKDAVIDVLILSGGGDYGSFGAGVLKGWGMVTDPQWKRPEWDVVTGVSTGALIAPLAFAGTEAAYERAYQVYQNPKPDWFKKRGLLDVILRKESLTDPAGLRAEITRTMDQSVLESIAQGSRDNRVLVVGSTNIDLGLMTMWDLALIARKVVEGEDDRARFDDVVLASASIPAVFPPVEIDGDLHVDGGVTRNIAYTTDQNFSGSMVNIWKREHADKPLPRLRFWVIVNNQLGTPTAQVQPGWNKIMGRALSISIRSSTIGSLKALSLQCELSRAVNSADVEFRFLAIPEEWVPPINEPFSKETMVSLAQIGLKLGQDPASWMTVVPNPESPTGDLYDGLMPSNP